MDVEEAAARLRAARVERRTLERFTAADPGLDEAWGLAVQDADRAERLRAGERLTGAKLGLTSEAKQRTMGVHRPIVGFLTDAMEIGEHVDHTALVQPRVEPEVAFVLAADLDGSADPEDLSGLLSGICAALEVIDSRWSGYRFGLADVLADDTSAAGYLLGEVAPLPDDLAARTARFLVDGELVATTSPAAILGDPMSALLHLVTHLGARGEVLPAGSVVLAGAMTDAVPFAPGTSVVLEVDGLPPVTLARP